MKAKEDQIDELLSAYAQAAAKRLTKAKAEDARLEKERKLFEEKAAQVIKGVFRPVMQPLIARIDKRLFKVEVEKLEGNQGDEESYAVRSKKEEEFYFWILLGLDLDENKLQLAYAYAKGKQEKMVDRLVDPEDINETLIQDIFMKCLSKVCK